MGETFSDYYSDSYLSQHPELLPLACPVCGDVAYDPVRCCICNQKACRGCGTAGLDFRFACSNHPRLVAEHELEIRAAGQKIIRMVRHTWLEGDGIPLIEKTEIVSGNSAADGSWLWDVSSSELDRAINLFLLKSQKEQA